MLDSNMRFSTAIRRKSTISYGDRYTVGGARRGAYVSTCVLEVFLTTLYSLRLDIQIHCTE